MPCDEHLAEFAHSGSDAAFGALAERYSGLVYGSALRRTRSPEASEEIVQNVFVALARKAQRLTTHPALSAWLHRATMLESANYLRRESKRAETMQDYHTHQTEAESGAVGEPLPELDALIDRLPSSDRTLIVLRYFDGRSYREIGEALGKSEVASRKQAERALGKLARLLKARGVTASAAAIASALGAQLGEAAPAGVSAVAAQSSEIAANSAAAGGGLAAIVAGVVSKPKLLAVGAAAVMGVAAVVMVASVSSQNERDDMAEAVASANDEDETMPSAIPEGITKELNTMTDEQDDLALTPTGISEAVRAGDLKRVEAILAAKPELLFATNPANWAHLPEMKVHPWAARPVELAVVFGHADVVRFLLGKSATEQDPIGGYFEAFEIAIKSENAAVISAITDDVIRRVTERPQLIHFKRDNGSTSLFFAAEHGHLGLMEALLERGADPSAELKDGRRPVHSVAGDNPETRLLLEHGIDFDLWVAAAMGDVERAREILAADPTRVAYDFKPFSIHSDGLPLVIAASHGHLETVRLLLENGADVNGRLSGREFADDGLALLHSFTGGHYAVTNLLLDHGADSAAWVDSDHDFKYRVRESDQQAIKDRVLTAEEQKPPVKSPSFVAWTGELHGDIRELPAPSPEEALGAISAAIVSHNRHHDYANYKEIITVMLEQGADQNAWMKPVSEEGKIEARKKRYWHREHGTPLHWLSTAYLNKANYSPNPDIPTREELVDLAGLFLEFGADLEARHPISNHTPLSSAVEEGITEYVRYLLGKGAAVNRDDPPDTNPVELARRLGFREILTALESG